MITTHNDGRISFSFFRPHATSVHVAASFNGWARSQHPMNAIGNGWWQLQLALEDGDHTFQYIADGQDHYADFAAHGVELDEFGGWRSILTVQNSISPSTAKRPELLRVVEEAENPLSPIVFHEAETNTTTKQRPTRRAA